ncbi:putative alanine--tRNA ligase [Helianthus debilis subsp. tardiflorus]
MAFTTTMLSWSVLEFGGVMKSEMGNAKTAIRWATVFGKVYHDPVRIVAIGRQVDELLVDPENEQWSLISAELCGGTHISNTREAKAFALLSEEGIAKGIRRVTAITTDYAFEAIKKASEHKLEVDLASKLEGSLLEQVWVRMKLLTFGQISLIQVPLTALGEMFEAATSIRSWLLR